MITATIACAIGGGGATEESQTDTPVLDETPTKVTGSVKKQPTLDVPTQISEEPTSATKPTEAPKPMTMTEEPGERPTIMSPEGIEYIEVLYPFQYIIENNEDIEIVDLRIFRSVAGDDTILGIIKNTGDKVLRNPTVYIAAVNNSDEIIDVEYGDQFTSVLYPGEKIHFTDFWFDGLPEETAEIIVGIEISEVTSEYQMRSHDYEIISSNIMSLSGGKQIVSVKFRSFSEYNTKGLRVEITFLDSNNRIIGGGSGNLDYSIVIPPGGEGEIDFQASRLLGDYKSYELLIEGYKAEE